MIRRWWQTALLVSMTVGWTIALVAQSPAPEVFTTVPKDQLGQEQLPATPLVFAAYAFVWVVLIVYVFSLWRRLRRVERELAEVSSKLRARHP